MGSFGNKMVAFSGKKFLLDTYGGARLAYSLRNLKETTGAVVRVRRSSDNLEQDFNEKQITNGTLLSFVGGGNGFVTIWYDQSGNGKNGTQTLIDRQPRIVNNGVLVQDNGQPALLFDGVNDHFVTNESFTPNGYSFVVYNCAVDTFLIILGCSAASFRYLIRSPNSGHIYQYYSNTLTLRSGNGTSLINTQYITYIEKDHTSNTNLLRINNSNSVTTNVTAPTGGVGNIRIGIEGSSSVGFNGTMQEIVIFGTRQNLTLDAIMNNLNNKYNAF